MQVVSGHRRYSASDLVSFAACPHLTHLELANLDSPLKAAADTEETELLQAKGFAHEAAYLSDLQRRFPDDVISLAGRQESDEEAAEATRSAINAGAMAVFQATLLSGEWRGHADFLERTETPSKLGAFSYEVVDTKLARSSRAKFLVQLCLYSEMLAEIQGRMPVRMHVVLGDGRRESFVVDDYLRYFRGLKQRFLAWTALASRDTYPEQTDHCEICRWREICDERWEQDDHLNRVANITKHQVKRLREAGVRSLAQLASLSANTPVPRVQPETVLRLAHQARLQRLSEERDRPEFEVLPVVPGRGFNRLSSPDPGDLFFDMEGNPHEEGGLEYLFGVGWAEAGENRFTTFWAHTRDDERIAFERFIDFVTDHLTKHPGAHIYHYAPYEPTALKRLMSLHATREEEVDNLLRDHRLIDLYAVVREALRVGERSYSIKSIERFYRAERAGDVKTAGGSVVAYEKWKATGAPELLKAIEKYNEDDVRSTADLRDWLLAHRPAEATWLKMVRPMDDAPVPRKRSDAAEKAAALLEKFRGRLLCDAPPSRRDWSTEHHLRELLFHLLSFHKRCDKPVWWSLFARQQATEEDLLDDLDAIAGLSQYREPEPDDRGVRYFYRYPEQETKLKSGDNCVIVSTMKEARDVRIDEDKRTITFTAFTKEDLPSTGVAIGAGRPLDTTVIEGAIQRFVEAYLAGDNDYRAGLDFLRRVPPRRKGLSQVEALVPDEAPQPRSTIDAVAALDDSYLFVQGPPGAGKTFTGSHVIVELIKAGKRIAVTSNSHKAINNLLAAVERVAAANGVDFRGVKKSSNADSVFDGRAVENIADSKLILKRLQEFQLVAGTAWLFSALGFTGKFDYLFVDEAGQVSVANLIAMSTCAKNFVLLGDQMQLGQPIQGVHPGESGLSALDYLLQGSATVTPHMGVFLRDSWRMHPAVCEFISAAVYSGRLMPARGNENQRLVLGGRAHQALRPTGVRFLPVDHEGCSQRSDEEANVVVALLESLTAQRYIDRHGAERPMSLENVLVVAPYNLQVNLLKRVLPKGARVGTVDKFQGQEAEAVIVSMTTSSAEYLPRDIEFLFSRNRLNVAISRARCLALVVANPKLLQVSCKTPEQMALVNTLCWVAEYSSQCDAHFNELVL